jgi:hypothetical protein
MGCGGEVPPEEASMGLGDLFGFGKGKRPKPPKQGKNVPAKPRTTTQKPKRGNKPGK